jgi:hypothetical protein
MSTINDQRGAALVLTLFLTATMAVLAASLMFLSQSETYSSQNYKLMSQARYGAEAGLHKAVDYLLYSYTAPGDVASSDPRTAYNMDVSPVTLYANSQPVILSGLSTQAANYPIDATKTAFNTAAQGSMSIGDTTVNYAAYATLLSMRMLDVYSSTTQKAVQTWKITSEGTVGPSSRTARAQVSAIIERQVTAVGQYAAFALGTTCGSLKWSGGSLTNSYDSEALTYNADGSVQLPIATQANNGNVGTNGNLTEVGTNTTINGMFFTPRTGVGNCNGSGDASVAFTGSQSQVTGGIVQLAQSVSLVPPDPPSPTPPTTSVAFTGATPSCGSFSNCSQVAGSPPGIKLQPGTWGNVSMSSGNILYLVPGNYNMNSIGLNGGSTIVVDYTGCVGTCATVINVAGTGQGTPIDFSGGSVSNSSYDPSRLQIVTASTGTVKLSGGNSTAYIVYAPNADATLVGGSDLYGAVTAKTINNSGGVALHYDRRLGGEFMSAGNFVMNGFTWSKY